MGEEVSMLSQAFLVSLPPTQLYLDKSECHYHRDVFGIYACIKWLHVCDAAMRHEHHMLPIE